MIEITKSFLLLFGVCIYITYQIKKCVYNKKRMYICMWGCLERRFYDPMITHLQHMLFILFLFKQIECSDVRTKNTHK